VGARKLLPFHAEIYSPLIGIAVAEIGQTGTDRAFAIKRIFITISVIAAAKSDAAPEPVVTAGKARTGNIHLGFIQKLVIEIGDAVKIGAVDQAVVIVP